MDYRKKESAQQDISRQLSDISRNCCSPWLQQEVHLSPCPICAQYQDEQEPRNFLRPLLPWNTDQHKLLQCHCQMIQNIPQCQKFGYCLQMLLLEAYSGEE